MRRRESERSSALPLAFGGVCVAIALCVPARAQVGLMGVTSRYDLAPGVQVEDAGRTVQTLLERVDAYLVDGKWAEAVDTIRQVMGESGEKLLPVSPNRHVPTRTICHLKLVDFSPEALQLYRDLADPIAAQWFEAWQTRRDLAALERIVDEAFVSHWGDDALAALAEASFQAGHYARARSYWERILPFDPPDGTPRTWLSFPDTDMNLAEIRARLVMLTIFEGRLNEAESQLVDFDRLHPRARGRLGGGDVVLLDALRALIEESRTWPELPQGADWPTFAGSPLRHRQVVEPAAVGQIVWQQTIEPPMTNKRPSLFVEPKLPPVAENEPAPLTCHPVVAGNLLFCSSPMEILAIDSTTGLPAWGDGTRAAFRDPLYGTVEGGVLDTDGLGTARHTMTIADSRLYARMGSGVTVLSQQPGRARAANYLVCLDLRSQGRLLWKAVPEDGWAYEGAPLVRGDDVYVAMRRSEIRPQAHVACLDARTGTRRWIQFVCAAETPSRGIFAELTNGLLTLDGDTLYFSTNLGAVAALSATDGRIRWLTTYPRALQGNLLEPADHWARDLTPCLADRGTLYVAPADAPHILAIAADNGQLLWRSSASLADVVHLLGVSDDCLIAGGRKLVWIHARGAEAGHVRSHWPEGHEQIGYGRGFLTRDHVWWPTRTDVFVFDKRTARLVRRIDLAPRGAGGGHLLVAAGQLVIAASDRLTAFAAESRPVESENTLALGTPPPN
ncbi:MAG: PQQ-like beta-propeller repeat protein [Planctomycetaceae bacterium]|nr:PQQ-like beta-propeller repeat protein [Planctomycetaceae bacterium]